MHSLSGLSACKIGHCKDGSQNPSGQDRFFPSIIAYWMVGNKAIEIQTCLWSSVLLMQVNVMGVLICSREFVKQLKQRGVDVGHIILINR